MRAKLKVLMNAARTFVNSTGEGYDMAGKTENGVFMEEKPSIEYVAIQNRAKKELVRKTLFTRIQNAKWSQTNMA